MSVLSLFPLSFLCVYVCVCVSFVKKEEGRMFIMELKLLVLLSFDAFLDKRV